MSDRILTLLRPYIEPIAAIIAGTIADFLLTKVHVLGDFHDRAKITSDITQMIIWAVTTIIVWASSQGWLQRLKGDKNE